MLQESEQASLLQLMSKISNTSVALIRIFIDTNSKKGKQATCKLEGLCDDTWLQVAVYPLLVTVLWFHIPAEVGCPWVAFGAFCNSNS